MYNRYTINHNGTNIIVTNQDGQTWSFKTYLDVLKFLYS
jgi:hypothetical protein